MRHEEYESVPARWLMVPAGVEIDLDPPCRAVRPVRRRGGERDKRAEHPEGGAWHAAVCSRCGARQPEDTAQRYRSGS
jgi:hypothetical protein